MCIQSSIQDRQGVLFFCCTLQSFGPIMNTVNTFCLHKAIIMRERQARSYNLSAYYLTTFLSSLPIEVIFPIIFATVLYFIVGLNNYIMFLSITIVMNFTSIGLGFLCGAIAPTIEAATSMAPALIGLMILFSGFFVNKSTVPNWLSWCQDLSAIRWGFEAYSINEFKDTTFKDCSVGQANCVATGNQVLKSLNFAHAKQFDPIRNLLILLTSFHILAYITLRLTSTKYKEIKQDDNTTSFINTNINNNESINAPLIIDQDED